MRRAHHVLLDKGKGCTTRECKEEFPFADTKYVLGLQRNYITDICAKRPLKPRNAGQQWTCKSTFARHARTHAHMHGSVSALHA